jgi:hypothetical protein
VRENLEQLARNPNPGVAAQGEALLEPPEFPDSLAYLWEWYSSLRMGLGEGMSGASALSWVTLDAWARRSGNEPEPRDASALFYLDAATRNPGQPDEVTE